MIAGEVTQAMLKDTFEYLPDIGRFRRVRPGHGATVGKVVGHLTRDGFVRFHFAGKVRANAHMVWLWHHGDMPPGILKRLSGVNSDDRIENLEVIKKKFHVSYEHDMNETNEYGHLSRDVVSGIYEIRCKANGRRYVGSAVNFQKRWCEHYRQLTELKHHSLHMQRAWNKYGESAFVFRVIEQCSVDSLVEREQHYIDSLKPEFNSAPVAGSQLGYKHSEESRKKMSLSRDRSFSPMKGRRHSEESKRKTSESRKGKGTGPHSKERAMKAAQRMREAKNALTPSEVVKIRSMKLAGMTHAQVAEEIGRSYSAVADVVCGRTYRWVL